MRSELTAALGRAPQLKEIAERLDSDPRDVIDALTAVDARDAKSLDRQIDRGDCGAPVLAHIGGTEEPGFAWSIERAALRDAFGQLTDQERQILGLRFLYDLPQSEIAARFGISQMQVSRLLRGAIERIARHEGKQPNEGVRHLPERPAGHPANRSVSSAAGRGTADSALGSGPPEPRHEGMVLAETTVNGARQ